MNFPKSFFLNGTLCCVAAVSIGLTPAQAILFSYEAKIDQDNSQSLERPFHTLDYYEFCVTTPTIVTLSAQWLGGNQRIGEGLLMGIVAQQAESQYLDAIGNARVVVHQSRLSDNAAVPLATGNYFAISLYSATEWEPDEGVVPTFISEIYGDADYRIQLEGDITMKRILEGQMGNTFRITTLVPEPSSGILALMVTALFLRRRSMPGS
jgi:hypothetical protein